MPQNCCVPGCKKKVYIEDGVKISYHKFPEEKSLFKKWIVAIRRDVGLHFKVTDHTRVCSRHFKSNDFKPSFAGRKRTLKDSAIPSVFQWKQESPIRRKSPRKRVQTEPKQQTSSAATIRAPLSFEDELESLPTTKELIDSTNDQSSSNDCEEYNVEYLELKSENCRLKEELARAYEVQAELQSKIEQLEIKLSDVQSKVFTVHRFTESDKDISFCTGFPSVQIFELIYEFLNPGEKGENIFYWHSSPD
ncbi:THAP domain-containing protein 1 [Exaiptasia diaphana]|nr:THAP domain-containing protein 1 [Exaiptasia diaphana]